MTILERGLTGNQKDALAAPIVHPALLFEFVFDDETIRLWSEQGELSWDGKTWLGAGQFLRISPVQETTDIRSNGITVGLSGIPTSIIGMALQKDCLNRPATIWLALFEPNSAPPAMIDEPTILFGGRMDMMVVDESGETATVAVSIESRLKDMRRARLWYWAEDDHKVWSPDDRFFEYVAGLQDKEITWQKNR